MKYLDYAIVTLTDMVSPYKPVQVENQLQVSDPNICKRSSDSKEEVPCVKILDLAKNQSVAKN